jgi:hypothetical protein
MYVCMYVCVCVYTYIYIYTYTYTYTYTNIIHVFWGVVKIQYLWHFPLLFFTLVPENFKDRSFKVEQLGSGGSFINFCQRKVYGPNGQHET